MRGIFRKPLRSLSAQLLVLTIAAVVVVEVLVYVPALARFRLDFLEQKLVAGRTAALVLETMEGATLSRERENELLAAAGIEAVVVNRPEARQLILRSQMPPSLAAEYDLRRGTFSGAMADALAALLRGGEGAIQVRGEGIAPRHRSVEVVLDEGPLYAAMAAYSARILLNTLLISLAVAALIYVALLCLVVRPTRRITQSLTAFSNNPQDPAAALEPRRGENEIAVLEARIAGMQREIRKALRQRERLAELGLAVSQINHDLKNILATARLSVDSLKSGASPSRQRRAMERLVNAIGRAVALCEKTLDYGRAEEPPRKAKFSLKRLVQEVRAAFESAPGGVSWRIDVPKGLLVHADRAQLYRILLNLARNAAEALEGKGEITIAAEKSGGGVAIRVADTGPGIPERVRERLFTPFAATTKGSGSGLGLATARALARAHGGDLKLEKTGADGTVFALTLPGGKPQPDKG